MAALDGFLDQSSAFEILLVLDAGARVNLPRRLRRLKIRKIAWPRGRHLASAINAAAASARGDVLAVLTPHWRPLPGLVEYCRAFHSMQSALTDTVMLPAALSPELTTDPLLWWLDSQGLSGLKAVSTGVHNWRALRFDALSCKSELLRRHPLPIGADDEWLIKSAWAATAPVRVFVDPVRLLMHARGPRLEDVAAAEYRASFARLHAMRASSQTFAEEPVDDRFQNPEKYILSPADYRELLETVTSLVGELAGRNPRFAIGTEAEQFEILAKLYLVAVSHARSRGWADARAGRRARRS